MKNYFFSMATLARICALLALFSFGCERHQSADNKPVTTGQSLLPPATVLGDTSGEHQLYKLVTASSHGAPNYTIVFSRAGNAVAYKAERNGEFYVVRNNVAGMRFQEVSDITFSPDGKHLAYIGQRDGRSRLMVNDKEVVTADAIGTPIFSPDSKHLLYYFNEKKTWYLVVDGKSTEGSLSIYDQFFSSDGTQVISFEQADADPNSMYSLLKVRDLKLNLSKSRRVIASNRVYNADRSRVAAITNYQGKKRLIEIGFDNIDAIKEGQLYDDVSLIAFGSDGITVAYIADRDGKRFLVMNGKETLLPSGEIHEAPVVNVARSEAAVIVATPKGYEVCFVSGNDVRRIKYAEAAFLKFNRRGDAYAHVVVAGKQQQYVVNGKPGPAFDKSLPPLFTPDGNYVVCRVRNNGQRFVVILDRDAKLVRQHPAYEMVFEPVFSADGKSMGYGVKDGTKLTWKVESLP